ncbi:MAG: GNAT family N-acetyltransferase [Candidatus Acidiferrales bacterium]
MQVALKHKTDCGTPEGACGNQVVRILRSTEEVERVREFWSSCPGTLESDIDVFLAIPTGTAESPRPCVPVLYRGGEPAALLAGKIVQTKFAFRLGWLSVFRPQVNVLTIRGGLRGDASLENCRELVRATMACLKDGDASVAFFAHVDPESVFFRYLKAEPGFLFRDHITPIRQHRLRVLPDNVKQMYAELSSNERRGFHRISKKLLEEFHRQVRVDRFDGLLGLDHTLEVVEEIAKKSWQRTMGRGFSMDPSLLQTFGTLAQKGWLRVYILFLAEKPCAFWIGARYRGKFYTEYTGYDLAYNSYSPGRHLLSQIMEDCCLEGIEAIDFGSSDEEYKKRFGNVMQPETNLRLFAPSPLGFTLSVRSTITAFLHELTRAFLKRSNLIQRTKQVWRRVSVNRARTEAEPT